MRMPGVGEEVVNRFLGFYEAELPSWTAAGV